MAHRRHQGPMAATHTARRPPARRLSTHARPSSGSGGHHEEDAATRRAAVVVARTQNGERSAKAAGPTAPMRRTDARPTPNDPAPPRSRAVPASV